MSCSGEEARDKGYIQKRLRRGNSQKAVRALETKRRACAKASQYEVVYHVQVQSSSCQSRNRAWARGEAVGVHCSQVEKGREVTKDRRC